MGLASSDFWVNSQSRLCRCFVKMQEMGILGFLASSVVIFVVNVSAGFGVSSALVGLLGVAILYGVLHIGKETKGWSQLD